jgi:hypothetical protein
MRTPFPPNGPEGPGPAPEAGRWPARPKVDEPLSGARDPSYPDRRRLDSDVRAFLRQPSTPWIVFDRDSRISQFPARALAPTVVAPAESAPATTISSETPPCVRAIDPPGPEVPDLADSARPPADVATVKPRKAWGALVVGMVVLGLALVVVAKPQGRAAPRAASAGSPAVVSDTPPPTLAIPDAPKAVRAAVASDAPRVRRLGRLAIRGEARFKRVYMDGKLLLGGGVRSFDVLCGPHLISINSRTDGEERDVPCGGELVVSK